MTRKFSAVCFGLSNSGQLFKKADHEKKLTGHEVLSAFLLAERSENLLQSGGLMSWKLAAFTWVHLIIALWLVDSFGRSPAA